MTRVFGIGELGPRVALRHRGRALRARVPRDEAHAVGVIAVSKGHAEVGRDARRCSDARNDAHAYALGLEVLHLLAAAAEDGRIAALEPHYRLARLGKVQQQLVDLLLRPRMQPGLLADVQHLGRVADEL